MKNEQKNLFIFVLLSFLIVSLPFSFVSAVSNYSLTYDGNGNLITGDGKYREYNEFNQLVRVIDSSTGDILETYIYHPLEDRILIKYSDYQGTNNAHSAVLYINDNFVREYTNLLGTPNVEDIYYIKDDSGIVAEVVRNVSSLADDTKISSGNHLFINVSYSNESVSVGNLTRKWYYRAFINNTDGNNVSNSNITAYNSTGGYQFNLTTNSSGFTNQIEVIDYFNYGGSKNYYSLYTIYASHINYTTLSHNVNFTNLTNVYRDLFTFGLSAFPNDTNKFYHKNGSGEIVAWLGDQGNIVLKGKCYYGGNCDISGDNSAIFRNSSNNNVAFINSTGDLCISSGDCTDESESCNPTTDAFIVQNSSGINLSYIDFNGELCLTGKLYENSL